MARAISGLLVRNGNETAAAGVAASQEVEFNIPRGLAIALYGWNPAIITGAITAAMQQAQAILDLDGPGLANDGIVTAAAFAARQLTDTNVAFSEIANDALTSGGSPTSNQRPLWLPKPILTARNPGVALNAVVSSASLNFALYYEWVEISADEFVRLLVDLRT